MKGIICFLFVFVFSFCFYYTGAVGPSCTDIEKIGFTGGHVLIFLFLYYIASIYVFHIEKFKGSHKKGKITIFNVMLAFLPIFFPVIFLGIIETDCQLDLELRSFAILLPLFIFLMDRNGSIREKIVDDFEDRTNGSGGDIFFHYPPRTIGDIYIKLIIFLALSIILFIINYSL